MPAPADTNTMTEDVKDAWDEDKAKDYPEHDFDDTAAEEDPGNSAGFIGGAADQRPPVPKDAETTTDEKTENKSDEPEADAEASDTVTPSAEPDDDAPALDAGLISRAQDAGLSRDDISGYDQAQVEKLLTIVERGQDRRMLRREGNKEQAAPEPEPVPEELNLGLDPEYQDPEVIKAFKALDQRHQAQNKELRDQLGELTEHMREQGRRAHQSEFDSWVASLPKEYSEFLGEGPTSELNENGSAFKTRNDVALAAGAMESRMSQNGNAPSDRRAVLKRGLFAILGDKVVQIERAIAKTGEDKRQRRTTVMPTHRTERKPQEPLGDRAAHQWAQEFIKAEGLGGAGDDGPLTDHGEGI